MMTRHYKVAEHTFAVSGSNELFKQMENYEPFECESAEPLFAFVSAEKPFSGFGKGLKNDALKKFADMNNKKYGDKAYIKWNFTKFLIARNGSVVARFEPTEDMKKVREAVEAEINK